MPGSPVGRMTWTNGGDDQSAVPFDAVAIRRAGLPLQAMRATQSGEGAQGTLPQTIGFFVSVFERYEVAKFDRQQLLVGAPLRLQACGQFEFQGLVRREQGVLNHRPETA